VSSAEPDLDPLVIPGDIAVRLGRAEWDTEGELAQIEALCDDTSALIRSLRPKIDQWLADGKVSRLMVEAVAAQVLIRALTTVDRGGIPIVGESHPEYSIQYSQIAKAGLRLEADELKMITPAGEDISRGKAFSVTPAM
jgi:hypothetical protein